MIYNHYDSYYSYLGQNLLDEIKEMMEQENFEEWLDLFLQLKMVTEEDNPTEEDIRKCMVYHDGRDLPGSHVPKDFYNLLRYCQGSFKLVLQSGYALIQESGSIENSLFMEYCYVLDFDDKNFYFSNGNIVRNLRLCDTLRLSKLGDAIVEED